jgi:LCP family protein required for cell wall assembly
MSDVKKASNKRMWIKRGVILFLIVCAATAGAIAAGKVADAKMNKQLTNSQQTDNRSAENIVIDNQNVQSITVNGKDYSLKENVEAVLIMGVDESDEQTDSETYLNTNQADFLMLVVIDHDNKSYTSIDINRDTISKVPTLSIDGYFIGWEMEQLALAHTYGSGLKDSCENTVWAISEFLYDVPIAHYASLSIPAIGVANDAVGGVTVEIQDDFSEVDPTLVEGETVTLTAEQAETFVRGRYGVADQTNVNRMSRQQTFISAWRKQAIEAINSDSSFVLTLLGLVSDYMVSDMTINELSDLSNVFTEYTDNGILDVAGESVKGETYMEFYADDDALKQTVLDLFYDEVED